MLGFRYYGVASGRFLTRDPIGFEGGINLYEYVNNSPLMLHDSNGCWSLGGILKNFLPPALGGGLAGLASCVLLFIVILKGGGTSCDAIGNCLVSIIAGIVFGALGLADPLFASCGTAIFAAFGSIAVDLYCHPQCIEDLRHWICDLLGALVSAVIGCLGGIWVDEAPNETEEEIRNIIYNMLLGQLANLLGWDVSNYCQP